MKMEKEATLRPDYEPQTLISIKINSIKKIQKHNNEALCLN